MCYLATARARAAESVLDFLRSNSSLSQIPLLNARVRAHTNRGREIKTRCRAQETRADSCVRRISRCAVERLVSGGVAPPDFGTNAVSFSQPSRHKQVVKKNITLCCLLEINLCTLMPPLPSSGSVGYCDCFSVHLIFCRLQISGL